MTQTEITFPYEKQADPELRRMCGAACLCMVYRSLGKQISQTEIWPGIAKRNRFGSLASTTHLMVSHALKLELDAVAVQTRHPLQALRTCHKNGIRAILNHRLHSGSAAGHYSVLVDIDEASVVLHDPLFGPFRRLAHDELLELWRPSLPNSEIAGNALIAVSARNAASLDCELCKTPIPPQVNCPKCNCAVGLQPAALLGCANDSCAARLWNYLCCPACDHAWTFSVDSAQAAEQATLDFEKEASELNRLFGELDKFCGQILSYPAAANHPDIKRQIEFIGATKEKLKLAQTEQRIHLKTHQEQIAALVNAAKEKEEAHHRKLADLNRPIPPLDGDALGRALLKNVRR